MTKPLDSRQVAYAYVQTIEILPNVPSRKVKAGVEGAPAQSVLVYQTKIKIIYELLDSEKKQLSSVTVFHDCSAESETMFTMAEWMANASPDVIHEFILADKADRAGYIAQ